MDHRSEGRSTVSVDRDGPVWIVTIERPEVRNAVDGRTARALHDAWLIGQSRAMDLILAGRPVAAEEAFEIGLADRLVPAGSALAESVALARQLAAFPQRCLRADRRSVLAQWSLDEDPAIDAEMQGGLDVIASGETVRGAAAFARGQGRHGAF